MSEQFWERLKTLLEEDPAIVTEFSLRSGVHATTLQRWVDGTVVPQRRKLIRVARQCGFDLEDARKIADARSSRPAQRTA